MSRVVPWVLLWLLTLGMLGIDITWEDGLHLRLASWPKLLVEWLRGEEK